MLLLPLRQGSIDRNPPEEPRLLRPEDPSEVNCSAAVVVVDQEVGPIEIVVHRLERGPEKEDVEQNCLLLSVFKGKQISRFFQFTWLLVFVVALLLW